MPKLIYVIEDDENIRDLITLSLQSYNFEVKSFKKAEDALNKIELDKPSVACFDVMLPGMDGFSAIKQIRNNPAVESIPILIITARDNEVDKIKGFECGCDDYITKPFSVLELCARIKALIRRSNYTKEQSQTLKRGDIEVNLETREVSNNNHLVELTYKEYELLVLLMTRCNQVLDRETLLNTIWGYGGSGDTRTIDVHIRHLREKLGKSGKSIITIRGVGYRFVENNEEDNI